MFRLVLPCIVLASLAGRTAAASPDPRTLAVSPADTSKARDLVRRLGSNEFPEREAAQAELLEMGRLALPALSEGLNRHPSAEVRFRCRALIPSAAALDLRVRIESFLADAEGKFEHDLPGWTEFRKVAGATAAARGTFVDLIADAANRDLVLAASAASDELAALVAARKQEFFLWRFPRAPKVARREPSVEDAIALLFAESRFPSRPAGRSLSMSLLVNSSGLAEAVAEPGDKGRVYKAVVVRWIESRDDASSMNQAIAVASALNLKEAAGVADRLLQIKGAPSFYRGQAAMTIARLGAKEYLPSLESILTDETVLSSRRGNVGPDEIQLRDVGLVGALLLTDQDPETYGFVQKYKESGLATRFSYSNWIMPPDKRASAAVLWREWRLKNHDAATAERAK